MKDHVEREPRDARILIYDIEMAPNAGYTWGKWQQNVLGFIHHKYIISFAWRWYGEDEIHYLDLRDFPRSYKRDQKDDSRLASKLYELFDEADIVIAHNGKQFDQKEVHARLLFHDLPLASPYAEVDTKLVAKRKLRLNSNSLNDICQFLKIGSKEKHYGWEMWRAIIEDRASDPDHHEAMWEMMKTYNIQDVGLLTEVYDKFRSRGLVDNHPNLATITGRLDSCPKCGTEGQMVIRSGWLHTKTVTYRQYQCKACHSYSRERRSGTGPRFS